MISIPTLTEIYDGIKTEIENIFGITIPTFGKNVFRVMATNTAGRHKLIYLLLGKVQKNIFVDTADPASQGGTLERFGIVKLGRSPFPATAGEYVVNVTGDASSVIPAQTTFKSDDGSSSPGYLFILDTEYTLTGTGDQITLRALTAGISSELIVGDTLTATAPISGVESGVDVDSITTEPLAAESIEAYRAAAIDAYRLEPQGGAVSDYRLWAADAQGVAKVYPYAKAGDDGIIDLYVEATKADSTDGKGTPTTAILSDVEDVVELDPDTTKPINERGRRPLGVFQVNYLAITPLDVDITITGGSYTTAQQTSIQSALEEAIDEIRPFITGADVVAERDDVLSNNKIIFIIQSTVPEIVFTGVTLQVDSVTETSYQFTDGNIPYFNSVTFS